jgi:hypothetical protein
VRVVRCADKTPRRAPAGRARACRRDAGAPRDGRAARGRWIGTSSRCSAAFGGSDSANWARRALLGLPGTTA